MSRVESRVRRVPARSVVQPSQGRRHNLSVLLQALYTDGPMSRADLARHVGLTKAAVSNLVPELLVAGQAVELGVAGENRPGKPSTLVDINRNGLQVIGLDVTAPDNPRAAVLDLDGTILDRTERRLPPEEAGSGEALLEAVIGLARDAVALATRPVLGLGIGTPGIVTSAGVVEAASNLGWRDVPLRARLSAATGLPVTVSNDADAAAHAEHTLGAAGDHFVLVKLGQGVGCAVIVGGHRIRGAHSAAGEFGHVSLGPVTGAPCACGRRGCLETWLSVPRLQEAAAEGPGGIGRARLAEAGERLGVALAPVVAVLDLDSIVLSGPLHLLDGTFRHAVEAALHARLLPLPRAAVSVRVAESPEDIVLRGATALVLGDNLGVS